MGDNSYVVKMNFDGDRIWDIGPDDGTFFDLTSCDGGYAICGRLSEIVDNITNTNHRLMRINSDGDVLWDRVYDFGRNETPHDITRTFDDGFFMAGESWRQDGGEVFPSIMRTDSEGNLMWFRTDSLIGNIWPQKYRSSILDTDGAQIVAGSCRPSRLGTMGGLVLKIVPERSAPVITTWTPDQLELEVLFGDSISFSVAAFDLQEDSLSFSWYLDGELISREDSTLIDFNELGLFALNCVVSDGELTDTCKWNITVTDLYITAFTPDTLDLTLRRGSSVDFSIDTVRYVDGAPPENLWTVTNLDNPGERENGGSETAATITFNQSGNYSVEGLAYRDESSDAVAWNVTVRGAIWAFAPEELAFEVLPDSLVTFTVEPTVPDAEGQTIRWLVDGEVVAEDTALLQWSFGSVDNFPRYLAQVQVVVADTVEADTVSWEVTVREPDAVGDNRDAYPTRVELLSVSPNPFNSTLTIRFDVGARHAVPLQIAIHDISGRMVAEIASPTDVFARNEETKQSVGGFAKTSSVVWDASAIPAGVYFVRLQSGREIVTKKVVLMK